MTDADATIFEALLDYLRDLSFLEAAAFLVIGALCIRLVRGASLKELVGLSNDIVRGNEFRTATKGMNDRMDRTCKVVEDLREDVSELKEKIAHVDGQLEQFRSK